MPSYPMLVTAKMFPVLLNGRFLVIEMISLPVNWSHGNITASPCDYNHVTTLKQDKNLQIHGAVIMWNLPHWIIWVIPDIIHKSLGLISKIINYKYSWKTSQWEHIKSYMKFLNLASQSILINWYNDDIS